MTWMHTPKHWDDNWRPQEMIHWLVDSNDVPARPALTPAERRPTARKLRLFVGACIRDVWQYLIHEDSRYIVADSERAADEHRNLTDTVKFNGINVCHEAERHKWTPQHRHAAKAVHCLTYEKPESAARGTVEGFKAVYAGRRYRQAALIRSVFGNPFMAKIRLDPYWLNPTVVGLAETAYNEPRPTCPCVYAGKYGEECQRCHGNGNVGSLDPERLAVLSDALEEAGCDEAYMLAALRSQETHYKGFWPLDLLLGKV